jgi:hypothetical protein
MGILRFFLIWAILAVPRVNLSTNLPFHLMWTPPNLENGVPASCTKFAPIYLSLGSLSLNLGNGAKARSQDDLHEFLENQTHDEKHLSDG